MITEYSPDAFNDHIVRVTFTKRDEIGHISIKFGGNCRGLDILNRVTDFIETCDEGDIENLVENDCEFAYDADKNTFNVALNGKNRRTILPLATKDMIKELIVAIEITDCTPFPNCNLEPRGSVDNAEVQSSGWIDDESMPNEDEIPDNEFIGGW